MSQLNYVYKLTAVRAPDLVQIQALDSTFFESFETITEITEHRIEFRVEKHLRKEPNTAEITIYNLAGPTRDDFVRGTPMKIILSAGYATDGGPRLLFTGDLRDARNRHEGTEWITALQLGDGARAFAEARVNRSYKRGTPIATVVADLARAFGVSVPPEVTTSDELRARLSTGESIEGYASDELTRILAQYGFEWSFQGGTLQLLRFDEIRPGSVRVISQDDGMLGTPTIDPPKIVAPAKKPSKKVRAPKITVQHTLFPELVPGEQVAVQSRSVSGGFRLEHVTHEGDSEEGPWMTTMEATAR